MKYQAAPFTVLERSTCAAAHNTCERGREHRPTRGVLSHCIQLSQSIPSYHVIQGL